MRESVKPWSPDEDGWQPKLAALEAAMAASTRELATLAGTVHMVSTDLASFARATTEQLRVLAVDVGAAKGPRGTDWQVIIAAGVLVLSLSAAVIAPLSLRMNELQTEHHALDERMIEHRKELQLEHLARDQAFNAHQGLTLHPVGAALLARLEADLKHLTEHGSPRLSLEVAVLRQRLESLAPSATRP